jgi:hypothetical protein
VLSLLQWRGGPMRCHSPCHTHDTISKTHPVRHGMQGLSPWPLLRAFSTCTPFHDPIERWPFLPLMLGPAGCFARAVMRAEMRLIGRVPNGLSGKRVARPSAHCPFCKSRLPRHQFDWVNQDRRRRREPDRADRSDGSFQMNGQEILYLLRVTIESQSCGGAVTSIVGPWVPCDDIAPGGE